VKICEYKAFWLRLSDWDFVEDLNKTLCSQKNALHKPTSDGYEVTKTKWEAYHGLEISLLEASTVCCECHRLAPFCFFNGNTFVAVIRQAIVPVLEKLDAENGYLLRSTVGHYVAGTIGIEELQGVIESLPEIDTL